MNIKFDGYKQTKIETANPEAFWDYLFEKITKKMSLTAKSEEVYIIDKRFTSLTTIQP